MRKSLEQSLLGMANQCWPESGWHLVAIHEFLRQGGRQKAIDSALTIKFLLTMGDRNAQMKTMMRTIEDRKPKREGPSMERYKAAAAAGAALLRMLEVAK